MAITRSIDAEQRSKGRLGQEPSTQYAICNSTHSQTNHAQQTIRSTTNPLPLALSPIDLPSQRACSPFEAPPPCLTTPQPSHEMMPVGVDLVRRNIFPRKCFPPWFFRLKRPSPRRHRTPPLSRYAPLRLSSLLHRRPPPTHTLTTAPRLPSISNCTWATLSSRSLPALLSQCVSFYLGRS